MTKSIILVALLFSAVLVLIIKLENERAYLNREYRFLNDMGMRKRKIRRTMITEIENLPCIALSTGVILALNSCSGFEKAM